VFLPSISGLASDSFKNMSDKEWDQVMEVHLKGAFACTKAAWPHFRNQKFGRVINTSSAAGLYGVYGVPILTLPVELMNLWSINMVYLYDR
jgi:multifunctional beta-oxidation protein